MRAGPAQPGLGVRQPQTEGCPSLDPVVLPGSANLNWAMENPISTEVRLLDHPGSPAQDHKATKDRLKVTATKSQPGEGTSPPSWLLASSHPPTPLLCISVDQQQMLRAASSILVCKAHVVQRGAREAWKGLGPPPASK